MRNQTRAVPPPGSLVVPLAPTAPGARPARIDVFADISCPFAYVGLRRLFDARAARGSEARVYVRAWPLEWINGRPLDPLLVAAEIEGLRAAVAPRLFAGFDPDRFPRTTIPALGLAAAAYAHAPDIGEDVSMRVRVALFEEGRDITDPAVLRAIGADFGVALPDAAATEAAVRSDWECGRSRGVRGSPHFFAGPRNWFCPSLRIRHDGPDFEISVDRAALDAFYATALG